MSYKECNFSTASVISPNAYYCIYKLFVYLIASRRTYPLIKPKYNPFWGDTGKNSNIFSSVSGI